MRATTIMLAAAFLYVVHRWATNKKALDARTALAARGVPARVVSVPSIERFLAQDAAYRSSVLPAGVPRVGGPSGAEWGAANPADPRNRRRRCSLLVEDRGKLGTPQGEAGVGPTVRGHQFPLGAGPGQRR